MKKYIGFLFLFISFLFLNIDVRAATVTCPSALKKDLAQAASYVKVSYDIKDESEEKEITANGSTTTYKIPKYYFEITIYNIREGLSLNVATTGSTNKSFTIRASDARDGTYTFKDYDIGTIYNYKITVSSGDPKCRAQRLKTLKFTKPRYNAYSEFTYCQNSSNYYCQRFIGTEINIEDTEDFLSKIKVNNDKNDPDRDKIETKKELSKLIKTNWKLYLLLFTIIAGLITGLIVFLKRRQAKKGWKL